MDSNMPTGRPFDEGKWRTTRTHSNAQMAECYRQIFFCFAQPMLRAATKPIAITEASTPSSLSSDATYSCRTAVSLDELYLRHCDFVGSLANDTVISGPAPSTTTEEKGNAETISSNATVGAKYIPMPMMLAGTIYDNLPRSAQENQKAPPSLVAHIPYAFAEAIFKSFGTLEYFHYEPERGVGTVIFSSGVDGEVCFVTKHLTSMVVPSTASMRGDMGEDRGNIDDVFGDERKSQPSSKALPQLVPVVLNMEFAAYMPFFNPCLVSHAHDAAGTSRHLLRTFPVPYEERGEKMGVDLGKKEGSELAEHVATNDGWQMRPFTKVVDSAGQPSLPFPKVWAQEAEVVERKGKVTLDIESPAAGANHPEGGTSSSPKKHKQPSEKKPFISIQRHVIEEVLAVPITTATEAAVKLPTSLTTMDLWVAFACRFILWKPVFASSLLETAGALSNEKKIAAALMDGHLSEDEDELAYQQRITDANKAILSLALRSGSSLQQVMAVLAPVSLHKYTSALQNYLMQSASESEPNSNQPLSSVLTSAKNRLAVDYIEYSVATRRGLCLRKRLHYGDGHSLARSASAMNATATAAPGGKDANKDNVILRRLRSFHFDELLSVHYPSMKHYREVHKQRDSKMASSTAASSPSGGALVVAPFGSGEANFYELARRLVEDEALHCSMANIQYKLRAQNDGSYAYWWLELKLRKVASTWQQLIEERKNRVEIGGSDSLSEKVPSVWLLHTKTADFATQMGLDDPKAILFIASSSIVQLAMNVMDNSFLLLNMAGHPNGLPPHLLLQEETKAADGKAPKKPMPHLPAAEFPDVLSVMDEYATSGSANSLQAVLCPPAEFLDPRALAAADTAQQQQSDPHQQVLSAGGLGAHLLAQQQRYAGTMGMLVMITEFMWGSMRLPLLAMSSIGLVVMAAMWLAGA